MEPGVIVDGRYEIVSFLGQGGMCKVYKARHLLMDRPVAFKLLHESLVSDDESIHRFRSEAIAISSLEHPGIVKVYGFGLVDNIPYLAMEYFEGESLADLLRREKRLSEVQALPIFNQILDALAHAHERGIIHRDLKPSNVMLIDAGKTVMLVDFGIARILPESGSELQKLTQTGSLSGTLPYMSPEQLRTAPLDGRSDLYSMGCLMFEVLAGEPPFAGDTPFATMRKHLTEKPQRGKFLSGDFGAVVLAALEKEPDRRPQSAIDLKQALADPAAYMKDRVPQGVPKMKRFAGLIIGSAITAIALSLLVILFRYIAPEHFFHSASNPEPSNRQAATPHTPSLAEKEESGLIKEIAREEGKHPYSDQLADRLEALAIHYSKREEYSKAEPLLKRCLTIRERSAPLTELSSDIMGLATVYFKQRKYREAELTIAPLIAAREKSPGPEKLYLANTLDKAANVYIFDGKESEAERLLRRSLEIKNRAHNCDSSDLVFTVLELASLLQKQGRSQEAEPLFKRCHEIYDRLPPGSEKAILLHTYPGFFSTAKSTGKARENCQEKHVEKPTEKPPAKPQS